MRTFRRGWLLTLAVALCCVAGLTFCARNGGSSRPTVERVQKRGVLMVGTTGDYRPLTFREESGEYWGFGIDLAGALAARLGVKVEFVQTSWPTLTADVITDPQKFDLAIGGITITDDRKKVMLMSDGEADVMVTEITEAPWYVQSDSRLAAPLLSNPFTHSEIGILMRKGQDDLLEYVNSALDAMRQDGSLQRLREKYGLH